MYTYKHTFAVLWKKRESHEEKKAYYIHKIHIHVQQVKEIEETIANIRRRKKHKMQWDRSRSRYRERERDRAKHHVSTTSNAKSRWGNKESILLIRDVM